MSAPDFTIADEFRFLAIQCEEQAASAERGQDAGFIRLLAANIFQLGGHATIEFIARLIGEAAVPAGSIPDLLKRTAAALRQAAVRLDCEEDAA